MRSNDLKERMLRQPSRFWLVLSIVLLLAGLGFLGAFGHAQYQYGKSGRYYARLQQTAADPDGNYEAAVATYTVTVTQGTPTIDTSAITTVYSYGSTPTELSAYERAVLASGVNGAANPTGALTYQFYATQEGAESQTESASDSAEPPAE